MAKQPKTVTAHEVPTNNDEQPVGVPESTPSEVDSATFCFGNIGYEEAGYVMRGEIIDTRTVDVVGTFTTRTTGGSFSLAFVSANASEEFTRTAGGECNVQRHAEHFLREEESDGSLDLKDFLGREPERGRADDLPASPPIEQVCGALYEVEIDGYGNDGWTAQGRILDSDACQLIATFRTRLDDATFDIDYVSRDAENAFTEAAGGMASVEGFARQLLDVAELYGKVDLNDLLGYDPAEATADDLTELPPGGPPPAHRDPDDDRGADLADPPARVRATVCRIVRDTAKARWVKERHEYRCQICRETVRKADGSGYAEAHHIRPLGGDHMGPDVRANIVCLCPNHHAACDIGAIQLVGAHLWVASGHQVGQEFIDYHNRHIYSGGERPVRIGWEQPS